MHILKIVRPLNDYSLAILQKYFFNPANEAGLLSDNKLNYKVSLFIKPWSYYSNGNIDIIQNTFIDLFLIL